MKITSVTFVVLMLSQSLSAQPLINPSQSGKEVGGSCVLRLKPAVGDVFHYKLSFKRQVSIKNSDDLFRVGDWLTLKPNDKASASTNFFITITVRSRRINDATDFQLRIDSIHHTIDNNGVQNSFSSARFEDRSNPLFSRIGVLGGYDFGGIYDSTGSDKDFYGYYNVVDEIYAGLEDSLQTDDEQSTLEDQVSATLKNDFDNIFPFLPEDSVGKDSSFTTSYKEDDAVWGNLTFPMQKNFKQTVLRLEEKDSRVYAVFSEEASLSPVERVLDDTVYRTTLPTFTYENKDVRYLDIRTGMLAYSRRTEEKSFSMKIESKSIDKEGKSFATVQRSKQETVVELLR
ncbi:MAG: hypothetical protein Q8916_01245 [Bacteroidota bacterium]|nr:hypothetical protein [Bacteroidota bacterium]